MPIEEKDFLTKKRQLEQANSKLANLTTELTKVKAENKILKDAVDEEGVTAVQKDLLESAQTLTERESKMAEREDALVKREKASRVQELVVKFGVEAKDIAEADDPEKRALQLVHERLTKEKEEAKDESSPERLFESGNRGVHKKSVKDIDVTTEEGRKEFQQYETELKTAVPSRK